jgi:nicotinamide-nucleotide amidase
MLYNEKALNSIKKILTDNKLSLAVAESVTSGHLQAAFSSVKEAASFFQGGITAYNAGQKCRHLNIEPIKAFEDDCVSEEVACKMAIEVNKLFISDYGIAITGYAQKDEEKGIDDLFAFFSIAQNDKILVCKKIKTSSRTSVTAQTDYTNQVIKHFLAVLKKS